MATASQIAANIANAQHSTGPTTLTGKARSAVNASKYGFYAKQAVLLNADDLRDFDALVQSYKIELCPQSPVEDTLFNQIILAVWNLQRANCLEVSLAAQLGDPLLSASKEIDRLIAFRLRTERSFLKLLNEYRKLLAVSPRLKLILQNEPNIPELTKQPYVRPDPKVGRNEPCPCQSGMKSKHCCLRNEPNCSPSTLSAMSFATALA